MREKKVRIVCEVVSVPFTLHDGRVIQRDVWQEIYSSMWKVDCEKWMEQAQEKNRKNGVNKVYHIFVSEM